MMNGYLVPKEIVDTLQEVRVASREVFIPLPGLSRGTIISPWGERAMR